MRLLMKQLGILEKRYKRTHKEVVPHLIIFACRDPSNADKIINEARTAFCEKYPNRDFNHRLVFLPEKEDLGDPADLPYERDRYRYSDRVFYYGERDPPQ